MVEAIRHFFKPKGSRFSYLDPSVERVLPVITQPLLKADEQSRKAFYASLLRAGLVSKGGSK